MEKMDKGSVGKGEPGLFVIWTKAYLNVYTEPGEGSKGQDVHHMWQQGWPL